MERLSIEEIKEILNRDWNEMKAGYFCINDFRAIEQSMELLDELKAYRDAEEQGLLLRLPCKVGSTVYYIDDYEIYSDKVDSINIRKENEEYIFCIAFMDYRVEDFGKTVFLTREEAERALAEMQKG